MSDVDPDFLKQLEEAFVIEAREQLQNIMTSVINLESGGDEKIKSDLAEDILHNLHSMKGNSRAAGITSAEAVCQMLESALLSLRRKKELLSPEAADVFHSAIDLLDDIINKVEQDNSGYMPDNFSDVLYKLKMLDERQRVLEEAAAAAAILAEQAAATGSEETKPSSESAQPPAQEASLAPASIDPVASSNAAGTPSSAAAETVQKQSTATTTTGAAAASSSAASAAAIQSAAATQASAADKGASTRMALWKLDKLLRESEEMLILKQISEQHLEDLRDLKSLSKALSAETLRLTELLKDGKANDSIHDRDLSTLSSSLKEFSATLDQTLVTKLRRQQTEQRVCFNMVDGFIDSVKSLLMQDFTTLLSVVPKVVRDLSRELKKDVDLDIFGTEIEIDRRILEEIKDPVIHLVRNSLDHGIETSADRIAKGKDPRASLRIGARQDESGNVQLIISDDGKGISAERLKASAIKEGVISAEEASRMSDSEAIELMYRSAISTSETVTEISGRGLGMAIVRERIHDLGGRVIVETQIDKGTTFILQLPTKLSTFRGIQVLVAGHSFIIPTLHVHYAGRVLRSDIKQSGNRNIVNINGQLTSVQTMADVLRIDSRTEFKSRATRNYQQLLMLESGDRRAGFLVDEILHEHEVLVRGLSYPLVRVPNIAGATILGSGQVVPVLNIADLMVSSANASWADEKLSQQLSHEIERNKRLSELPVFLVERHSTSLVMLKTLLESEGYNVTTFESNETALEGLDFDVPLILLKSCELSETQESGLAYWIRKDLRLKDLPIVFFGSVPIDQGQELSKAQGGNAYFSKIDFDRKQILALIEGLT